MRIHVQLLPDDQPGFTQQASDDAAVRAGVVGSGHQFSIGRDDAAFVAATDKVQVLITADGALRRGFPL